MGKIVVVENVTLDGVMQYVFGDLAVRLELAETVVTGKGVIIAYYRPGSVA